MPVPRIPAFVLMIVLCCACRHTPVTATAAPVPASAEESPSRAAFNDRYVRLLMEHIAGREQLPAREVFRNVELLGDVPAGAFIRMMEQDFAASLDVKCTYCHVSMDFSSDLRRPKRAAREMIALQHETTRQLQAMESLETTWNKRAVSCATCHTGTTKPGGRGL